MSLLAVQSVLAQLYTDSAFRARFFDAPGEACPEIMLTEAERRQLAGLDRGQVERFARSLQRKRLGLARELLPGTARVMGDRFAGLFFEYCDSQPSALDQVEEAKAFARRLSGAACRHDWDLLPDYLSDLLACERLRLEALYPTADRHLYRSTDEGWIGGEERVGSARLRPDTRPQLLSHAQVRAFDYDMEAIYPRTVRGEAVEAAPDACFILIGKLRGAMRVRLKRINAVTARLLTLCDGTRTLAVIVEEVAAGLRLNAADRQSFEAECARFLAPLIDSELIGLCDDSGS